MPLPDRRLFTHALLGAAATALAAPWAARAQPRAETLRIVCGYPPGGSVDVVCRKLAERLGGGRFAAQAVVENKPGAAGRLAVDELKKAPPDGSALLVTPASVVTLYPHVYRQLAYDPFTDLAPVAPVAALGFVLAVGPLVPATVNSVEGFVQWCRAQPAAPSCGNPGAGSMPHLMAVMLAQELGLTLTHVPYRGGSAAMPAVAAGEVAAAVATEASALPLVRAGRLRVLATSWAERSPFFAQTATFREQGLPRLTQREWFGSFMPARTPAATVQAAADALGAALQDPEVRSTWERTALLTETGTPAQLLAVMRQEHGFWGPVVKAAGFTPES